MMLKAILKFISPARRPEDDYAAGAGWVYVQVRLEGRHPLAVERELDVDEVSDFDRGAQAVLNDLLSLPEFKP